MWEEKRKKGILEGAVRFARGKGPKKKRDQFILEERQVIERKSPVRS